MSSKKEYKADCMKIINESPLDLLKNLLLLIEEHQQEHFKLQKFRNVASFYVIENKSQQNNSNNELSVKNHEISKNTSQKNIDDQCHEVLSCITGFLSSIDRLLSTYLDKSHVHNQNEIENKTSGIFKLGSDMSFLILKIINVIITGKFCPYSSSIFGYGDIHRISPLLYQLIILLIESFTSEREEVKLIWFNIRGLLSTLRLTDIRSLYTVFEDSVDFIKLTCQSNEIVEPASCFLRLTKLVQKSQKTSQSQPIMLSNILSNQLFHIQSISYQLCALFVYDFSITPAFNFLLQSLSFSLSLKQMNPDQMQVICTIIRVFHHIASTMKRTNGDHSKSVISMIQHSLISTIHSWIKSNQLNVLGWNTLGNAIQAVFMDNSVEIQDKSPDFDMKIAQVLDCIKNLCICSKDLVSASSKTLIALLDLFEKYFMNDAALARYLSLFFLPPYTLLFQHIYHSTLANFLFIALQIISKHEEDQGSSFLSYTFSLALEEHKKSNYVNQTNIHMNKIEKTQDDSEHYLNRFSSFIKKRKRNYLSYENSASVEFTQEFILEAFVSVFSNALNLRNRTINKRVNEKIVTESCLSILFQVFMRNKQPIILSNPAADFVINQTHQWLSNKLPLLLTATQTMSFSTVPWEMNLALDMSLAFVLKIQENANVNIHSLHLIAFEVIKIFKHFADNDSSSFNQGLCKSENMNPGQFSIDCDSYDIDIQIDDTIDYINYELLQPSQEFCLVDKQSHIYPLSHLNTNDVDCHASTIYGNNALQYSLRLNCINQIFIIASNFPIRLFHRLIEEKNSKTALLISTAEISFSKLFCLALDGSCSKSIYLQAILQLPCLLGNLNLYKRDLLSILLPKSSGNYDLNSLNSSDYSTAWQMLENFHNDSRFAIRTLVNFIDKLGRFQNQYYTDFDVLMSTISTIKRILELRIHLNSLDYNLKNSNKSRDYIYLADIPGTLILFKSWLDAAFSKIIIDNSISAAARVATIDCCASLFLQTIHIGVQNNIPTVLGIDKLKHFFFVYLSLLEDPNENVRMAIANTIYIFIENCGGLFLKQKSINNLNTHSYNEKIIDIKDDSPGRCEILKNMYGKPSQGENVAFFLKDLRKMIRDNKEKDKKDYYQRILYTKQHGNPCSYALTQTIGTVGCVSDLSYSVEGVRTGSNLLTWSLVMLASQYAHALNWSRDIYYKLQEIQVKDDAEFSHINKENLEQQIETALSLKNIINNQFYRISKAHGFGQKSSGLRSLFHSMRYELYPQLMLLLFSEPVITKAPNTLEELLFHVLSISETDTNDRMLDIFTGEVNHLRHTSASNQVTLSGITLKQQISQSSTLFRAVKVSQFLKYSLPYVLPELLKAKELKLDTIFEMD